MIIDICRKLNFKKEIDIEELTKEFKLSKNRITKGFKFIYRKNIYQYRIEKLMRYAALSISEGKDMNQLAQELGYSNSKSFSRDLKGLRTTPESL